jgi:hypothetical protein
VSGFTVYLLVVNEADYHAMTAPARSLLAPIPTPYPEAGPASLLASTSGPVQVQPPRRDVAQPLSATPALVHAHPVQIVACGTREFV